MNIDDALMAVTSSNVSFTPSHVIPGHVQWETLVRNVVELMLLVNTKVAIAYRACITESEYVDICLFIDSQTSDLN